jgi:hypothetical protein
MVTKQKLVNIRIICLFLLTHFKYNNIHFQYIEYFIYTKLFSVNCNSILIAKYPLKGLFCLIIISMGICLLFIGRVLRFLSPIISWLFDLSLFAHCQPFPSLQPKQHQSLSYWMSYANIRQTNNFMSACYTSKS